MMQMSGLEAGWVALTLLTVAVAIAGARIGLISRAEGRWGAALAIIVPVLGAVAVLVVVATRHAAAARRHLPQA